MTTPSLPSTPKPSTGTQAILSGAGAAATTVGAIAAATSAHPKLSLGLAALSALLSFLGAFSHAPNTVKATQ